MSEDAKSHSEGYSDSADLDVIVDALKVLAHPVRLRILQWLRDPRAAFLRALEREGLVTSTRIGKWTHYKRDEKRIAEIRSQVATLL